MRCKNKRNQEAGEESDMFLISFCFYSFIRDEFNEALLNGHYVSLIRSVTTLCNSCTCLSEVQKRNDELKQRRPLEVGANISYFRPSNRFSSPPSSFILGFTLFSFFLFPVFLDLLYCLTAFGA